MAITLVAASPPMRLHARCKSRGSRLEAATAPHAPTCPHVADSIESRGIARNDANARRPWYRPDKYGESDRRFSSGPDQPDRTPAPQTATASTEPARPPSRARATSGWRPRYRHRDRASRNPQIGATLARVFVSAATADAGHHDARRCPLQRSRSASQCWISLSAQSERPSADSRIGRVLDEGEIYGGRLTVGG